jgi:hypothetical protein
MWRQERPHPGNRYSIQCSRSKTTVFDLNFPLAKTWGMGRYVEHVYINDVWPRWVAIFDLQWKVIESQRFGPDADLPGMMLATIERLAGEGREIEALPRFRVSFIRRDGVRRLLILTPKDPHDDRSQSFNPFK